MTHFVECPVCGMEVDEDTAEHHYEYRGKTYTLCSENCMEKFVADPEECLCDDD